MLAALTIAPWVAYFVPYFDPLRNTSIAATRLFVDLQSIFLGLLILAAVYILHCAMRKAKTADLSIATATTRLDSVQDRAKFGSWELDLTNREISWSRQMFHLMNRDPELGPPSMTDLKEIVHPDDLSRSRDTLLGSREAVSQTGIHFRTNPAHGPVRHLHSTVDFIEENNGEAGRVFGTTFDLTERVAAERALRESHDRYDLITEHAEIGIFDRDITTDKTYYSAVWKKQLGYAGDEISDRYEEWADRLHPDDRERTLQAGEEFFNDSNNGYAIEFRLRHRDGSYRWISAKAGLVRDDEGVPLRMLGVHLDITERKQADEERSRLRAQTQHAQKLESLGLLAGGVAHDFNNNLTVILANAEMTRCDLDEDSPYRERMSEIVDASQRAAELCNQLLLYSGRYRSQKTLVRCQDLVREMAPILRVATSRNVNIIFDLDHDAPPIQADPTQLRQVIMNLVVNASEAIGDASGTVTLLVGRQHVQDIASSRPQVDSNLRPGEYAYIEVADDGCGMDERIQSRVFEPFFTTKFENRGLGMPAVLGIVRSHDGAMALRSRPGEGSMVRVLFPSASTLSTASETPEDDWSAAGSILLVDDEELMLKLEEGILQNFGFKVYSALNGRDAVASFQDHKDDVVCVLLDLNMPEMSGQQVLEKLRSIDPKVRTLVVSGFSLSEFDNAILRGKRTEYIQKPFRTEDLKEKIRSLLHDAEV